MIALAFIVGLVVGFALAVFVAALGVSPILRQVAALEERHKRDREMVDEALAVLSRRAKGSNGVPAQRPMA